ncbi:hypothetical protein [Paractinoplanes durhamensis]|uniref:Uncharacterized protein n=1 Tax=Paractinoplanes durhamensis TaxID=113563 RepID=A0ABQ3YTP3_9ACTN|nr:hypothetical protein [Actinoplanes durhamensis]GIE00895.1 hypothetical protein Adu01nite_22450 [Actinoplanes durhamensis]
MSAGWFLAVTVTAALSGIAKHCLHLWGERARYRHEETLARQRHSFALLVLRQPAATEVQVVALMAGTPPPAASDRDPQA